MAPKIISKVLYMYVCVGLGQFGAWKIDFGLKNQNPNPNRSGWLRGVWLETFEKK